MNCATVLCPLGLELPPLWDLIDSPLQAPWAKNGKYEYCHLFSNSQNSPKYCSHGLHALLN